MTEQRFKAKHIAARFGVDEQTIYNRTAKVASFMSPSATPGKNKPRWYTERDVQILTFVAQELENGASFDEIAISLHQPDVKLPPATLTTEEIDALLITDKESRAILQVQVMGQEIHRLQEENARLDVLASQSQEYKEQAIRFEKEVELLREQLAEQPATSDLYRQIGKLEAQIEFLREQLDK